MAMKPGKTKRASRIHQRIRRKKCPSSTLKGASASTATKSAATPNGDLQSAALGQIAAISQMIGTAPKPKDGDVDQLALAREAAVKNGLTAAQAAASSLGKRPDPTLRVEAESFELGVIFILHALVEGGLITNGEFLELVVMAEAASREFFPAFDPPPPAVKRAEDGRRPDGIKMEN